MVNPLPPQDAYFHAHRRLFVPHPQAYPRGLVIPNIPQNVAHNAYFRRQRPQQRLSSEEALRVADVLRADAERKAREEEDRKRAARVIREERVGDLEIEVRRLEERRIALVGDEVDVKDDVDVDGDTKEEGKEDELERGEREKKARKAKEEKKRLKQARKAEKQRRKMLAESASGPSLPPPIVTSSTASNLRQQVSPPTSEPSTSARVAATSLTAPPQILPCNRSAWGISSTSKPSSSTSSTLATTSTTPSRSTISKPAGVPAIPGSSSGMGSSSSHGRGQSLTGQPSSTTTSASTSSKAPQSPTNIQKQHPPGVAAQGPPLHQYNQPSSGSSPQTSTIATLPPSSQSGPSITSTPSRTAPGPPASRALPSPFASLSPPCHGSHHVAPAPRQPTTSAFSLAQRNVPLPPTPSSSAPSSSTPQLSSTTPISSSKDKLSYSQVTTASVQTSPTRPIPSGSTSKLAAPITGTHPSPVFKPTHPPTPPTSSSPPAPLGSGSTVKAPKRKRTPTPEHDELESDEFCVPITPREYQETIKGKKRKRRKLAGVLIPSCDPSSTRGHLPLADASARKRKIPAEQNADAENRAPERVPKKAKKGNTKVLDRATRAGPEVPSKSNTKGKGKEIEVKKQIVRDDFLGETPGYESPRPEVKRRRFARCTTSPLRSCEDLFSPSPSPSRKPFGRNALAGPSRTSYSRSPTPIIDIRHATSGRDTPGSDVDELERDEEEFTEPATRVQPNDRPMHLLNDTRKTTQRKFVQNYVQSSMYSIVIKPFGNGLKFRLKPQELSSMSPSLLLKVRPQVGGESVLDLSNDPTADTESIYFAIEATNGRLSDYTTPPGGIGEVLRRLYRVLPFVGINDCRKARSCLNDWLGARINSNILSPWDIFALAAIADTPKVCAMVIRSWTSEWGMVDIDDAPFGVPDGVHQFDPRYMTRGRVALIPQRYIESLSRANEKFKHHSNRQMDKATVQTSRAKWFLKEMDVDLKKWEI